MKKICSILYVALSLFSVTGCATLAQNTVSTKEEESKTSQYSTVSKDVVSVAESVSPSSAVSDERSTRNRSEIKLYSAEDLENGTVVALGEIYNGWILKEISYYDDSDPSYIEYSVLMSPVEEIIFTGEITCTEWYDNDEAYIFSCDDETMKQIPLVDPGDSGEGTSFWIRHDFTETEKNQLNIELNESKNGKVKVDELFIFKRGMCGSNWISTNELPESTE